jgi:mRNA interferase HigB
VGQVLLQRAARRYGDAANAIAIWAQSVASARWRHLVDLKADFPSADYVAPLTVFNIRGNNYRLVAIIDYAERTIVVRDFLTHAEYDKGNWK